MPVTRRTYRKHESMWNSATSRVNSLLKMAEDPEHYFETNANRFDVWTFLSTSRSNSKTRGGLNLQKFYLDVCSQILFITSHWCDEAEAYMMHNHKWHNRTGDAERGLFATIGGIEAGRIVTYLYHSVPYGVYLETRDFPIAGNLSIIRPTLQIFSPKLTRDLQNLLDTL